MGCAMLALAAGASNGAMTQLFGDSGTTLFFWCLNTNYPQTQKSELSKLLAEGSAVMNELVHAKAGQGRWAPHGAHAIGSPRAIF